MVVKKHLYIYFLQPFSSQSPIYEPNQLYMKYGQFSIKSRSVNDLGNSYYSQPITYKTKILDNCQFCFLHEKRFTCFFVSSHQLLMVFSVFNRNTYYAVLQRAFQYLRLALQCFFFCLALYIILLMRFSFLRCQDIFKEVSTMQVFIKFGTQNQISFQVMHNWKIQGKSLLHLP